jgi:hypothetical protein
MSAKQKIYIIFLVIIAFFVLAIIFAIKPLFLEIKKTAAAVSESRGRMMSLEEIDKNYLEELEIDRREISNDLNLVKKQLIDKNEAVKFFEALESVASMTSNEIEISASDFPSLTLSLTGTFPDLMKFLGWLENGDYFIDVDSLNISRKNEKPDADINLSEIIKSTIKIRVYIGE